MAITDVDKIDVIGIDKLSDQVILTITDHLDWDDEAYHIESLVNKINSYIQFIENGQIYKEYPEAENRNLIIEIVSKFEYPAVGKEFIKTVEPIVNSVNTEIIQRLSTLNR